MHFANPACSAGAPTSPSATRRPIADGQPGAAAALRERIRPFVLRRLKRDVAPELPPRTDAVLHVELDDGERAVYDAVRAATQKDVLALLEAGGGVMKALEALLRLRQAACHPALVPGQTAATLVEDRGAARGARRRRRRRPQGARLLAVDLPPRSRSSRTSSAPASRSPASTARRAIAARWSQRFQADDGPPVMLVSLKAGGTGLNLTAADHVFLCDPWWNPAVEDQAADRAHRIGQTRPVMVYRLVAADTVEERILALQDSKRALMDAALGDGAAAAGPDQGRPAGAAGLRSVE